MALAKLLGFDLCPRLADLGDRKLFVPRGIEVPDVLLPITERLTLGSTVRRGWDSLVRIAASINGGWCSATTVLDLYGAAAKGDPAYECGNTLGKLCARSICVTCSAIQVFAVNCSGFSIKARPCMSCSERSITVRSAPGMVDRAKSWSRSPAP